MLKFNKKVLGKLGEDVAVSVLESNGYRIIERNFRIGRLGEIDIIARDSEFICFVEVKTRTCDYFGMPSEAVGKKKQEKLRTLAMAYLKIKGLQHRYIRFDIAEIYVDRSGTSSENDGSNGRSSGLIVEGGNCLSVSNVNIIKNAF